MDSIADSLAGLMKARDNVRLSLLSSANWREEARDDFAFVQGSQWEENAVNKRFNP